MFHFSVQILYPSYHHKPFFKLKVTAIESCPRKKAFIGNVTVNGHPIIDNIGQDKETKWIFTVPANPDPTLTWLAPNGEEIDYGFSRYEMDVDANNDQGPDSIGKIVA